MKRNLLMWQFAGFVTTAVCGTLLHFIYDLTNENIMAAAFSAVNESTWEHMKLMYFPMFIFALVQSRFFGEYKSFWCVKLTGITAGLVMIPVLYYTCSGAFFLGGSCFYLGNTAFQEGQYALRQTTALLCGRLFNRRAVCTFYLCYAQNSVVSKSADRVIRAAEIIIRKMPDSVKCSFCSKEINRQNSRSDFSWYQS